MTVSVNLILIEPHISKPRNRSKKKSPTANTSVLQNSKDISIMTVDNNKAMAWPQSRVARTEDKSILTSSEQQKQEFYFSLLNEFLLIGSNRLDMDMSLYSSGGWMLYKLPNPPDIP